MARHNSLRDFTASFHPKVSGYVSNTEQRVTAWDRVNPRTGLLEEARLDVATRVAGSGRTVYVDANVTCAHSGYEPRQRARAGKDGVAVLTLFGKSACATHPRGANLFHLSSKLGADQLRRLWHSFAIGLRTWKTPSARRSSGMRGSSIVAYCSQVMLR